MRTVILMCGASVIVILAYVSTQIYSAKLLDAVLALKQEKVLLQETVNDLTGVQASLSSRAKVIGYCEEKLGMTKAPDEAVIRVAVEERAHDAPEFARIPENDERSRTHVAIRTTNDKVMLK
ncbi:MAG: hypothetical protein HY770_07635 [Chitinivibrionia bacterium]|nr:hypothetical protein [Chitinivibrionia bacterium]